MARLPITGLKSPAQIQAMRDGGRILAQIFADIRQFVAPGVTERQIDDFVAGKIRHYGAIATYQTDEVKFPGVICISVNDQIVHGVPTDYALEDGDVVGFDLVITYQGMKTDSAFTMVVGSSASGAVRHLIKETERSLYAGIDAIRGQTDTREIGRAVEQVLDRARLGIIRNLVGHGVGTEMHMPPEIPNYYTRQGGALLVPGDTIAIEPMATLGGEAIRELDDGWTIATRDGSLAAHFEHTVLVTKSGAEILTTLD